VTCQIKADFDGCLTLLTRIVNEAPIYLLNSWNPYRLEGQRRQPSRLPRPSIGNVPDPPDCAGRESGQLVGAGKGFREMLELGLVARMPRISVIQAAGGESAGAEL